MSSVAVVILNWNGKDILAEFLPSVVMHSKVEGTTIYVADNGSTDSSVEYIEKTFPTVKIIKLDKNYGFAGGYNRAIETLTEDYVILLNSDVEVSENWLHPLIEYMDHHNEIAACQPKIRSYRNKKQFEYAGAAGGYIDKYGFPFCRGRFFNVFEEDNGQYDQIEDIFWATGACLFIRTEIYKQVGGLDDDFFAHMEEIDLCWRIWARGYKIVYIPHSTVYHLGGATLNKTNPHKTFLNFRNNLYLLYKNLHIHYSRRMFVRYILDFVAFIKFILGFEYKNAGAVLRAHRDFLEKRKYFKTKRIENQEKTIVKEIPVIYHGSIVFDFFFKGKKYFHQLNFYKK
ncbi:MAG TPA: glycosyltransferase family 2 protein [Bacteroidales bacterium]|nr:glycosyltransferase family 2 protein [Bacteroidales bacterium]